MSDGDVVTAGQPVAELVSQESSAAVEGARAMLETAKSPAGRAEAQRALDVAEAHLVKRTLRLPAAGAVASHQATQGDLLSAHDEILTIADERSIAFVASVPQSELSLVRPGQAVEVALSALPAAVVGLVRAVLPAGADSITPVRIALELPPAGLGPGLFGVARIVVGVHRGATAVPAAAVLRDDITGSSRLAIVDQGKARWVEVKTGLAENGSIEIVSPPLKIGAQVIVQGQVGLPDGAAVRPES